MRRDSLLIASLTLSLTACASTQETTLRHDIELIEGRIAKVEQSIEEKVGSIASDTNGIRTRVRFRPLVAWTEAYNARPGVEKTISFRQTGRNGRLAGDDYNCGLFGSGGWYVELNSSDATRADLLVNSFALYYGQNQLTLGAPLRLDAETRVHWHIDPCIGGGFGGNVYGDGDASGRAFFRLELLPMVGDELRYRVRLVDPSHINVRVRAHIGQLGTKEFTFDMGGMAHLLTEGTLTLLVDQGGQIGPLPNGLTFTYRVKTSNPAVGIDELGFHASSNLELEIDPALKAALREAVATPQ